MAKPANTEDDDGGAAPKSKKKLFIIIGIVIVLLAAAGGGAWFLLGGGGKADSEAHKVVEHKDPIFVSLDSFTVNLQREEGSDTDKYLQIGLALEVVDPALDGKIKAVLPEIRSKLNLILSSRHASEIASPEGKKKLAADIASSVNYILGFGKDPNAAKQKAEHKADAEEAASLPPPVAEGPNPEELLAPAQVTTEIGYSDESAAQEKKQEKEKEKAPEQAQPKLEGKGVLDVLFTAFIIQ